MSMQMMNFQSVHAAGDAMTKAGDDVIDARNTSRSNTQNVIGACQQILDSKGVVDNMVADVQGDLKVARTAVENAEWISESRDKFFATVDEFEARLNNFSNGFTDAYNEAMATVQRLQGDIEQLDADFGNIFDPAADEFKRLGTVAHKHADDMQRFSSTAIS